jgi:hypothetical protein
MAPGEAGEERRGAADPDGAEPLWRLAESTVPREWREPRELRKPRESREPRELRESRESRELREQRESRESREPRVARVSREATQPAEPMAAAVLIGSAADGNSVGRDTSEDPETPGQALEVDDTERESAMAGDLGRVEGLLMGGVSKRLGGRVC